VEKLTGFHFFTSLPEELAEAMRDHLDEVEVRTPKPRKEKKEVS
jgi:hypothetical protein